MQTRPFQSPFLPVTPSELEIITLHSFQQHEAAMAQQGGGTDISQAPSDHLWLQKSVAMILRLSLASLLRRTAVELYVLKSPSVPDNLCHYVLQ